MTSLAAQVMAREDGVRVHYSRSDKPAGAGPSPSCLSTVPQMTLTAALSLDSADGALRVGVEEL